MMKPIALLTTIPSDSHNWNLIYMQLLLEENGFNVINLGACTAYEVVEEKCMNIFPDILVVSTVNGHGYLEGKELIGKVRTIPSMEGTPAYIGGKLSTDKNMSYIYAMELEMAGYDKAYYENMEANDFIVKIREQVEKTV